VQRTSPPIIVKWHVQHSNSVKPWKLDSKLGKNDVKQIDKHEEVGEDMLGSPKGTTISTF